MRNASSQHTVSVGGTPKALKAIWNKKLREMKCKQQEGRCFWCWRSVWPHKRTLEHLIPKSMGGTETSHNVVMACEECNSKRDVMDASEYLDSITPKDPDAIVSERLKFMREEIRKAKRGVRKETT